MFQSDSNNKEEKSANHIADYSATMKQYLTRKIVNELTNDASTEDDVLSEDELTQKKNLVQDVIELSQQSLEQNLRGYCNNISKLSLSAYQLTQTAKSVCETAV